MFDLLALCGSTLFLDLLMCTFAWLFLGAIVIFWVTSIFVCMFLLFHEIQERHSERRFPWQRPEKN